MTTSYSLSVTYCFLSAVNLCKQIGPRSGPPEGRSRSLSYTYTSIALDARLLAQAYLPSQIELSSPGIQKSCRGLIPGLIPGLIFFCPALPSSWFRPGEKTGNICKTIVKNKESGRILAYFYLIPTKIVLTTLLKHWIIHFLTPSIPIQNGGSVKLSNAITSQRHNRTQRFREQTDRRNAFEPLRLIKSLNLVIVKIKKLIDYFISSFTRISIW